MTEDVPATREDTAAHDADAGHGDGGGQDTAEERTLGVAMPAARRDWPATAGRGAAMGLADVVPGVSGGTVALILGIHPRLITAIRAFDRPFLRALADAHRRQGRRELWHRLQAMDTPFLVFLALGIGLGILAGAWTLEGLMHRHPVPLRAFFFGLILASVRIPLRMMPTRGGREAAAFLLAAAPAFLITVLRPVHAPEALWFMPVAGAIALCAMILPGVSGAFLLLLMGLYEPIVSAIKGFDLPVLLLFGTGGLVGILAFSRVLHRLLTQWPGPTLAALAGLMLGSLGRTWPFKEDGGAFAEGANLWPGLAELPGPLAAAAAGALLVLLLEATAARTSRHPATEGP